MQVLGGNERIDVLFTDVIMPGEMRGPQLAVEAQKIRPELKVILTTGYNDIVDIDAQSEGHEFGLLRKPYRRVALAKALSDMLASEPS
jgi:DNA-binding NtrC family response regulator